MLRRWRILTSPKGQQGCLHYDYDAHDNLIGLRLYVYIRDFFPWYDEDHGAEIDIKIQENLNLTTLAFKMEELVVTVLSPELTPLKKGLLN